MVRAIVIHKLDVSFCVCAGTNEIGDHNLMFYFCGVAIRTEPMFAFGEGFGVRWSRNIFSKAKQSNTNLYELYVQNMQSIILYTINSNI